jgi:hypothetical protein
MNFSDVGQMQVGGNNKLKHLEKLYLQKYPGHASSKTAQHFNQYVNTPYQGPPKKKEPPQVHRPQSSVH